MLAARARGLPRLIVPMRDDLRQARAAKCRLDLAARRLVAGYDETHFFDHPVISLRRLAFGGEIVADEDGIGDVEGEGLEAAEVDFAAAGDADFALGVR